MRRKIPQIGGSEKPRALRDARRPVRPFAFLLVFLCALFAACTKTPTPTVETVHFSIMADPSTAPLLDRLVTAYLADRTHVTIQTEYAANVEQALEALRAGQFDLIGVSWLPGAEKEEGRSWYRPFARDSIVLITHPTNPVGGLTLLQLRDVFQGQTLFWSDLGGADLDIVPISREDGAGTRLSFEALVMGGRDVTPTAVVMPSNEAVVAYVSATPGAIGYVSTASLAPSVNLLGVEGVVPSPESVKHGRYLLARPFYLAARVEAKGSLAEFVDWVKEGEGHEIVKRDYALAP